MQLACHPRYMSQYRLPAKDLPRTIKSHADKIKAVMADPSLDEDQKYRATKRIIASIDFHTALRDATMCQQKAYDVQERAEESGPEAKDEFDKGIRRSVFEECLPHQRNLSTRFWQVSKLYIFAPWGEVGMSERFTRLATLCVHGGIAMPLLYLTLQVEVLKAELNEARANKRS